MSLISALNIAVSSVGTLNTAIKVVSDNVANADNENYNARTANFGNLQTGGVYVTDITRQVNRALLIDLQSAITDTATNGTLKDYYERVEDLLGVTGSQTPLIDKTEALSSAWKAFEAAPESSAAEKAVISAAENLTRELSRVSSGLDTIDQSLANDIEQEVDSLNDTLTEIDRLNDTIVRDKAKHLPVATLESLRDEQILFLSEIMDIKTIYNEDGSVAINATSGLDLTIANASTFTWNAGTSVLTKSGSTSTNLVTDNKLPIGRLNTLIDLARTDDTAVSSTNGIYNPIEKMRNQLDEFAFSLIDDSVTRTTGTVDLKDQTDIVANTAVTAGQTLTINAGGQAAATTITIAAGDSITDLLASINAITNVEGRVDAHGRLQILTSAENVAIGGTALTGLGLTAATYTADDTPTLNYAYGEESAQGATDISGNANLIGLGGINDNDTFTIQVNGGATSTITFGVGAGEVNSTTDLLASLNNIEGVRAKVTDDGYLRMSTVEGDLIIQEGVGNPLSSATGLGFGFIGAIAAVAGTEGSGEQTTGFFEVIGGSNLSDPSRINIRVNDVFSSGAKNLKDGSGTVVVSALSSNNRSLIGSGLNAQNENYTGMMSALISDVNNRSSRYENLFEQDSMIMTNLSTKLRNEVGVDLDEEMAMLTVLQNSYAATARVISTVNQMFQTLEQAVR